MYKLTWLKWSNEESFLSICWTPNFTSIFNYERSERLWRGSFDWNCFSIFRWPLWQKATPSSECSYILPKLLFAHENTDRLSAFDTNWQIFIIKKYGQDAISRNQYIDHPYHVVRFILLKKKKEFKLIPKGLICLLCSHCGYAFWCLSAAKM